MDTKRITKHIRVESGWWERLRNEAVEQRTTLSKFTAKIFRAYYHEPEPERNLLADFLKANPHASLEMVEDFIERMPKNEGANPINPIAR